MCAYEAKDAGRNPGYSLHWLVAHQRCTPRADVTSSGRDGSVLTGYMLRGYCTFFRPVEGAVGSERAACKQSSTFLTQTDNCIFCLQWILQEGMLWHWLLNIDDLYITSYSEFTLPLVIKVFFNRCT